MPSDATIPVQAQLSAYNARDIEAFMACWAPDCRTFAFPDTLLAQGRDAVRARHVERFREPDLHGRLLARLVVGSLVIDHETVTRTFADGPGEIDVAAIYEVTDGLIAAAWFRMGTPRAYRFRRAAHGEAGLVRGITRAAYARWVPVIGREPRPMTADYEDAVSTQRVELFCIGGEPAGLIQLIPAADHLVIENVAIQPEHQGKGLGHRLLARAEVVARELGLPELRLYTHEAMAANIRLYRRLGYRIDRREPFMGGFTVHMSKPVA